MAALLMGIDIGFKYTKVVVLEQGVKLSLADGFFFPTPIKTNKDGEKLVDPESFVKELKNFISLQKLRHAKIAVNLPPTSITALSVYLPLMSKKELLFAATNEARQKMIPVSGPSHIFECLLLGETMINKIPRAEVLVIRTEKLYISRIIEIFQGLEVYPVLIAPACTILPNVIPKAAWKKDEAVVLVDIGAQNLKIFICSDENMVFMRNVVYGLGDIIQDFSHQLGIQVNQTEEIIRELGVPAVPYELKDKVAIAEEIMRQKYEESLNSQTDKQSKVNLLELRMLWQPHIERITQEFRRSIVFYKEQPGAKEIRQVYFLGGGSNVKNLISILSGLIGVQIQVILAFNQMQSQIPNENKFKDEIISSALFTGSASLALGIPQTKAAKETQVNFLPVELKQKEAVAARRIFFLIVGGCFISVFILLTIQLFFSNVSHRRAIKRLDVKLETSKQLGQGLNKLVQKQNLITRRNSLVEDLIKKRPDFLTPLQKLAGVIPSEILLNECTLLSNKIDIKASIFADYEEADRLIREFKAKLETTKYFRNIEVAPLELELISPKVSSGTYELEVNLTQSQTRDFSLSAEIGASLDEHGRK